MAGDAGLIRELNRVTLDLTQRIGDAFAERVEANAPRRTGELAESVEVGGAVASAGGGQISVTVTAEHGVWQDKGTGIYGPRGGRIHGNPLLAFDWPAAGGLVIVRSVSGTPPTHFFQRAVEDFGSIVRSVA